MKTHLSKSLVWTAACVVFLVLLSAARAQDDPVMVRNVSFTQSVQPYQWNAVAVDLETRRNPEAEGAARDFLEDVTVRMTLGYDPAGRREDQLFLQSEVTLSVVKERENPSLVFLIPQQVVERYELRREADYWLVEIEIDGQSVDLRREHAGNLASLELVQSFKNAASEQIGRNEGYMLPYYLTPYTLQDIQRSVRTGANFNRYAPAILRKDVR